MRTAHGGASALSEAGVEFDSESGELRGPAGDARVAPQPAALLAFLVENAGTVVSRSNIRSRLWPGGRVEFDQGIAFAVREIRKALEGVGVDPGLVETLPRRGFRVAAASVTATAAPGPGGPSARHWRAGVGGVLLGLAIGMTLVTVGSGEDGAEAPVVAVFPHDPLDGTPSVESVSMAEALTVHLTTELDGEAGVVGPTGTADLTGPNDTEKARTALGACLILSGSLRWMESDSAVVFTQLVRAADRVHVWARWDTLPSPAVAGAVAAAAVAPVRTALLDC